MPGRERTDGSEPKSNLQRPNRYRAGGEVREEGYLRVTLTCSSPRDDRLVVTWTAPTTTPGGEGAVEGAIFLYTHGFGTYLYSRSRKVLADAHHLRPRGAWWYLHFAAVH